MSTFRPSVGVLSALFGTYGKIMVQPCGIVNDTENTFFVASNGSHVVSKITSSGMELLTFSYSNDKIHYVLVRVVAGSGWLGSGEGGPEANFHSPEWLAIDQQTGTLFVSDSNMIKKITNQGGLNNFHHARTPIHHNCD